LLFFCRPFTALESYLLAFHAGLDPKVLLQAVQNGIYAVWDQFKLAAAGFQMAFTLFVSSADAKIFGKTVRVFKTSLLCWSPGLFESVATMR